MELSVAKRKEEEKVKKQECNNKNKKNQWNKFVCTEFDARPKSDPGVCVFG